MKFRVKIVVSLTAVLMLAGASFGAVLTGMVDRMLAESAGWSLAYQDQSVYPSPNDREGCIIRFYSWAADGGTTGSISLERGNVVTAIPDNTIIWDGFIEVLSACQSTGTPGLSLGIETTWDILGTGTTLNATGIDDITPDGTAANSIKLTASRPLNLNVATGGDLTNGMFMVYMRAFYGQ